MQISTYLFFDGNTREAFDFYASRLGGKILQMTSYGDAEIRDDIPVSEHAKIMHGCIEIGGGMLMATDSTPAHPYRGKVGMNVVYTTTDPAEAERVFAAFAEGGKVTMPIGKTFWARAFGVVTDRFDTPWMINCP